MFDQSRRRFVRGLATSAGLAAVGSLPLFRAASAEDGGRVLHGPEIDLSIAELPINLTGVRRIATAVNGGVPGPLLRWREGDDVTVRVTNRLSVPTSIHWHGVIVPADMDGVPGVSFKGIGPGETF